MYAEVEEDQGIVDRLGEEGLRSERIDGCRG